MDVLNIFKIIKEFSSMFSMFCQHRKELLQYCMETNLQPEAIHYSVISITHLIK
jgi:hypothetical protein